MLRDAAYDLLTRAVRPVARGLTPFSEKLARAVAGRAQALTVLRQWGAAQRNRAWPLVWFHAPSVGEALMAQAIVQAVRAAGPPVQIAFTHFSPSAERMRERIGADVSCYLPWDTTTDMRLALDALQPTTIAFVRTEIWPTLMRLADARNVRTSIVNAVLSADSSRLKPFARLALRPSYRRLDAAGVVSADVAARIQRLGLPAARVRVTGDARFDQVWQRVSALDQQQPLLERLREPSVVTIVAGSTWPADDDRLIPAFAKLATQSRVRLLLAPHEPTTEHLHAGERGVRAAGLSCARLAAVETAAQELPSVILIDRVGVLADLYAIANVAYVGGGFHSAGVHSVVEPAALGVPVVYGPTHGNASEAGELASVGGGTIVHDQASLLAALSRLTEDGAARRRAGEAARAYVVSKLGGAQANAQLVLDLIAGHG